jgi:hypothetical protein|tara:strand:+ start:29 stop:484 length:456 start_codon:yes stop_codon:yes gene_type:complete
MLLQNPLKYLLDNFYTIKYKKENKKYTNKNINFYIAATYKKTQRNKKFKKLQYIFNPFTALYLQRNIYSITDDEVNSIINEIDTNGIINNPRYDLHEYYKNDPMSQHEFYSLKNYNFYDTLFFEYAQHKDGERIFKELYEYESKKLNLSFY